MKSFLLKLVLFSLPVLALLATMEYFTRKIPNDYREKHDHMETQAGTIEVLVLGNSHSYYGVAPEFFHFSKAYNAALISQSLDYDLRILKKYQQSLDHVKVIMLNISYPTLFIKLDSGSESWRIKNYTIYYDLPSWNIAAHSEIISLDMKTNIGRLNAFYSKKKDPRTCSSFGNAAVFPRLNDPMVSGPEAAKRHTVADTSLLEENLGYLQQIIDIAQSQNAKVLLLTTPVFSSYSNAIDQHQWSITQNAVAGLVSKNSNTVYADYLTSPDFTEEDFYDGDHLNKQGAQKLSARLDTLVAELILPDNVE